MGDASGECGITFSAAAGYPAEEGDIAWTVFPSGVYLTLYRGEPIEEYRLDQPIRQAGTVALRTFLSTDISTMGDTVTLSASGIASVGAAPLDRIPIPDIDPGNFDLNVVFDGVSATSASVCEYDPTKIGVDSARPDTFQALHAVLDLYHTTRSRAYELGPSELVYSATPNALRWPALWVSRARKTYVSPTPV